MVGEIINIILMERIGEEIINILDKHQLSRCESQYLIESILKTLKLEEEISINKLIKGG